MVEWADVSTCLSTCAADCQWVMRPSEHIQFWSDETHTLGRGDAGSSRRPFRWWDGPALAAGTGGQGVLLSGDIIQVVADHRWVSFMYSYPNLIPLPAATVLRIKNTIARWHFECLYGAWFDRVVGYDAYEAVMRSAERYVHALEMVHQ